VEVLTAYSNSKSRPDQQGLDVVSSHHPTGPSKYKTRGRSRDRR
jgi:hypothetical protein